MASILVVAGPNEGDYYPMKKRTLVIGRDEGAAIQITDQRISRKHLQLRFEDAKQQYLALDMKSANGTLINGRAVTTEVALVDGDEISIGSSKIVFSTTEFADRESAFANWKQRGERGKPTIQQ
ncbi:MAG TPA: FHA domain-containing protein [Phycisphaerales bacterium]|nr:FHA domain-containing protein [Phycisphaerales bacterium]